LPILILTMFQDVGTLANLYAVGVVGAIAINLGSCCVNKQMPVKNWERMGMGVLALIMIVIEATLVYEKPDARWFALFVLSSGLIARFFTKNYPVLAPVDRAKVLVLAGIALVIGAGVLMTYSVPLSAGLHELIALLKYGNSALYAVYTLSCFLLLMAGSCASTAIRYIPWRRAAVPAGAEAAGVAGAEVPVLAEGAIGTPAEQLDMDRPHIMVAARGGERLIDFAASYARDVRGILFVVYVRQINVAFSGPVKGPALEEDPEAQGVFKLAAAACRRTNVQMVPIYVVSPDVAYSILDFAATYAVRALLMGVSRKATLLRALHGDVLTAVADNLPGDIPLLIHA